MLISFYPICPPYLHFLHLPDVNKKIHYEILQIQLLTLDEHLEIMHTKLLIRDGSFTERYQHWNGHLKIGTLQVLRDSYAKELCGFGEQETELEYGHLYTSMKWHHLRMKAEHILFLMEYFKTLLTVQQYNLVSNKDHCEVLDRGIKKCYYTYTFGSRTEMSGSTKHFGDIYFELLVGDTYCQFEIRCQYQANQKHWSFEKLMEILLQ